MSQPAAPTLIWSSPNYTFAYSRRFSYTRVERHSIFIILAVIHACSYAHLSLGALKLGRPPRWVEDRPRT